MPTISEAFAIAIAHHQAGRFDLAGEIYRRILAVEPNDVDSIHLLGVIAHQTGRHADAVELVRRAIELSPAVAGYHNNLGEAYRALDRTAEAIECYRRAIELKPDYAEGHSNLLYTLLNCPGYDAQSLYAEHRRWSRQHAEPLAGLIRPHLNDRSPQRRLRIGYVSPDFRFHPIGRFLLPLLESHDHQAFEIFCYSSVQVPDAITHACRAAADVWRDVPGLSDQQLADAVREDRIDVLVDLSMHMAHNRMLVFARKPAPVQVTYLAYCGTTGLTTIDYRLTDPYLDPPGADESFYTERSLRLPETYWCYRPPHPTPAAGRLPALAAGHVTFGCLNNFCKVTAPTLAAWTRLLQAVPGAKLLLHARPGSHRQRVQAVLAEQGVAPERVALLELLPIEEYLRLYQRIDVALDPFPYGGGTTTCDALWMGVPVVSRAGQTGVGRGGLSILSNSGLPELVARDADEYVRIARELAADLPRLAGLRSTLRDRMQNSPLMDEPRFARGVEAAFRQMWRTWCGR